MQLAFVFSVLFAICAPSLAAEKPNIILVMCDDLGWKDVGFNGGKIINTPNLDEMASNSLKFARFYAQAPVCSPTRGSCLTGRHPFRYGIVTANAGHMKTQELTLAELLKEHGYTTGHFGKWHIGTLTKTVRESNRGGKPGSEQHFAPPQDNGFDVCFSTEAKVPTFDPMLAPANAPRNAWNAITDRSKAKSYGTHYWNQEGEIVNDNLDGDDSKVIMDRAIPFIRSASENATPFFAVIWFHAPHLPVVADAEHRAPYSKFDSVHFQNYFGCVSAMDEQIGRLRSTLRELGTAENTLITFCSDNGPEGNSKSPGSAGKFRGRKRSLYEGGVRVPGLIEWPAVIEGGASTDFPAVTSDYLPTIVDIIGAELGDKRPIDGVSLYSTFRGKTSERSKAIGFESKGQLALSDNRFKLIRPKPDAKWELYDLISDPSEKNDLAVSKPDVVSEMSKRLLAWQASCAASSRGADYTD